jgi:hypothetical protein
MDHKVFCTKLYLKLHHAELLEKYPGLDDDLLRLCASDLHDTYESTSSRRATDPDKLYKVASAA